MSDANETIKAYDCDSHVEESEETWSEKYWDPQYAGRRPMLIETDEMGNLSFLIDSIAHPRITGPGVALSGGPVSKNGKLSPAWERIISSAAEKGHTDTMESAELRSGRARLDQMDRENVAVEVNFPSVLLTWPIAHDPKIGCAVARSYNDWIADMSSDDPTRLKWVTVIDPNDIEESVREIQRTKKMGSAGLMLLGVVGDKHLDDPYMEPVWRTVAELDMPVAIHPGFPCPALDNMFSSIFDCVTIPFVFSQLIGFHTILRSGLLDRYPNLRVGFMENGARWVDYMSQRIAENCGRDEKRTTGSKPVVNMPEAAVGGSAMFRPSTYTSELLPEEYIQRGQIFVNCEVDEDQLPFVIDRYGDDFLLFASDIPHGHRVSNPMGKLIARDDLGATSKRKILVDNVARFYGFPLPKAAPEPAA
jgi:predicted TIM-barrel fold metal-dependent hydrolase